MICNRNSAMLIGSGWLFKFSVFIFTKYLLREAPKSAHVQINSENYKYEFGDTSGKPIAYISYYNDMKRNRPALDRQLKSKNTKVYLYFI